MNLIFFEDEQFQEIECIDLVEAPEKNKGGSDLGGLAGLFSGGDIDSLLKMLDQPQ